VTTADEAQSISVIDTFPQLAEAEVAPSDSANAAVAVNILSFICVSLLSFFLHRPVSRPCDPRSGFGSRVLGLCILSSMNLTKAVEHSRARHPSTNLRHCSSIRDKPSCRSAHSFSFAAIFFGQNNWRAQQKISTQPGRQAAIILPWQHRTAEVFAIDFHGIWH
jgi:hypothetical protein